LGAKEAGLGDMGGGDIPSGVISQIVRLLAHARLETAERRTKRVRYYLARHPLLDTANRPCVVQRAARHETVWEKRLLYSLTGGDVFAGPGTLRLALMRRNLSSRGKREDSLKSWDVRLRGRASATVVRLHDDNRYAVRPQVLGVVSATNKLQ
jgi:hypothetical protein